MDLEALTSSAIRCLTDPDSLSAVSRDKGGIASCEPKAVAVPESPEEVAWLVREIKRADASLTIRGAGRTTGGQSLNAAPVVLDMGGLDRIDGVADETIRVEAGVTWRSLLEVLIPQRLLPPGVPADTSGTIGGSIAAAALGFDSHRTLLGEQCSNLEVVTGRGEEVTCGPVENKELFRYARGSLGQLCIVTGASLKLYPAPSEVQIYHLLYGSLESLIADLIQLTGSAALHVQARCAPALLGTLRGGEASLGLASWSFVLKLVLAGDDVRSVLESLKYQDELAVEQTSLASCFDPPERLLAQPRLAGARDGVRPGLEWILPAAPLIPFLQGLLSGLPPEMVSGGRLTIQPRPHDALKMLRRPDSDRALLVALDCPLPRASARQLLPLLDRISRLGRRAGGYRHPGSWLNFCGDDWQEHFGSEWAGLVEAKHFYDPEGILNQGGIPLLNCRQW